MPLPQLMCSAARYGRLRRAHEDTVAHVDNKRQLRRTRNHPKNNPPLCMKLPARTLPVFGNTRNDEGTHIHLTATIGSHVRAR